MPLLELGLAFSRDLERILFLRVSCQPFTTKNKKQRQTHGDTGFDKAHTRNMKNNMVFGVGGNLKTANLGGSPKSDTPIS